MSKLTLILAVVLAFALPAAAARAEPSVLEGQWHLENMDGSDAFTCEEPDSSGGDNTMCSENVGTTTGKFGKAGTFFDDSWTLIGGVQPPRVTAIAWVNASQSPGQYRYVIDQGSGAHAGECPNAAYALYTAGSGGLTFYVTTPAGNFVAPAVPPSSVWDGQWHMAVGTYDGSTARFYLDGAEVGSGTPVSGGPIDYTQPNKTLHIGQYGTPLNQSCNFTTSYHGLIDEVRLYKEALTHKEIAQLAAAPASSDPSGPVLEDPLEIHMTSADEITTTTARINGTIDDAGEPRGYQIRYGIQGQRDQLAPGGTSAGLRETAQPVHVTLTGLQPGTDYRATIESGAQSGGYITFHTRGDVPDTTIADGPSGIVWMPQNLFEFSSSLAGSRFECRVDGADFAACASPFQTGALPPGDHTFEVRAVSSDGVPDPTPAARTFTVGTPSAEQISCELAPVRFVQDAAEFHAGCLVGRKPSFGCTAFGFTCKWEEHICPVGAKCVATTTGDYSTSDRGIDVKLGAAVSFADLQLPYNVAQASGFCNTDGVRDGCRAQATLGVLGNGQPLLVWCQAHHGDASGAVEEHPDQRRIDCASDFRIELAAPLTTLATGTDLQVLPPAQGTLTGTATIAGAGGAAVSSRAKRPRIATFRRTVRSRRPLTVHLKLNRPARRLLHRRHRLRATVRLAFTPRGGQTQRRTKRITLTAPARTRCPAQRHRRRACLGA